VVRLFGQLFPILLAWLVSIPLSILLVCAAHLARDFVAQTPGSLVILRVASLVRFYSHVAVCKRPNFAASQNALSGSEAMPYFGSVAIGFIATDFSSGPCCVRALMP
jgi:hypothetical protein